MSDYKSGVVAGEVGSTDPASVQEGIDAIIAEIEQDGCEVVGNPQVVPTNFQYSGWDQHSRTWSEFAPTTLLVIVTYRFQDEDLDQDSEEE